MNSHLPHRQEYEDSCLVLQEQGLLAEGEVPPCPDQRPSHADEEPLGVSFFRTQLDAAELEDLTLPRTFFGNSQLKTISFQNSDLSESTLTECDLNTVDFSDADLSDSVLCGSRFKKVTFARSDLRGADLRDAEFENCDFADANLQGTKLTAEQCRKRLFGKKRQVRLTAEQLEQVDWQEA